jgi:hypothetical protein
MGGSMIYVIINQAGYHVTCTFHLEQVFLTPFTLKMLFLVQYVL